MDRAVVEAVDAVLLAGDIVDRFNRSFEAYGPLARGVRRLAEAGIPVVAVAGNHDFDTLPDLAAEVGEDRLTVLGVGGRWERWTLEGEDGRPRLHVDGWSFPRERWTTDPTEDYTPEPTDDIPLVCLLHCDLDKVVSSYGPVRSATLLSHSANAWVLGHVHAPRLAEVSGSSPILYPGSLQALDPGESGARGAWTLQIGPSGASAFEMVPLSASHYATVDVDVEGLQEPSEVTAQVRTALADHLSALAEVGEGRIRAARCRVRLTGRTALHDRLERILEGIEDLELVEADDIRLAVDSRVVVDTHPVLDLADLARGNDPPAHLAALLLALEEDEESEAQGALDPALLEGVSRAAARIVGRSHYAGLRLDEVETDPESPRVRDALRRQATRLLDALVSEREAP